MTTTSVLHTVRFPDSQTPRPDTQCRISLVGPGFVDDDEAQIIEESLVKTDANGLLTMTLTPNTEIDPDNSYYTVAFAGESWNILVPVSADPVWLKNCLIVDPQPGAAIVTGNTTAVDNGDGTITFTIGN